MASAEKNLSTYTSKNVTDISSKTFAIITSEWNDDITGALSNGAIKTLKDHGVPTENIIQIDVPGTYELTLAAQKLAQYDNVDAIICIGCVIKGETSHNEYINHAVAQGLTDVSLKYDKPVIFGVLTPNDKQQAIDRAGGKYGNKGDEAAITAIKMLAI